MSRRSRWEPKPLLEENPWSLLPNIGLSVKTGWLLQGALPILLIVVYLALQRSIDEALLVWLLSAVSLGGLTQRLGGREVWFGAACVTPESTFQERLAVDIAMLAMFAISLLVLLIGFEGWRRLIGAL
jgi:hypothetical protein